MQKIELHKLRELNQQINGLLYQQIRHDRQAYGSADGGKQMEKCPNCHLCQTEIYRLKQENYRLVNR